MAIKWGTEVRNSTWNGMTLGYEVTQTPSKVTSTTQSVTLRLVVWVKTRASVIDSNNTAALSGRFTGSKSQSINHGSSGGTTVIWNTTTTVSTIYGKPVTSEIHASLTGIEAIPGTARVRGTWTTGARPRLEPYAPTRLQVDFQANNRIRLEWDGSNKDTAGREWTGQELQRWDSHTDGYKTIANLEAHNQVYMDRASEKNRRYRYRIRSKNLAGASSWTVSNYVSTTPLEPKNVRAVKSGTGIKVTWDGNHIHSLSGFQIAESVNGGPLSYHGVVDGTARSWVHTSPSSTDTHRYSVRAVAGFDSEPLYSEYVASNEVLLLAPPLAPSDLTPHGGAQEATDAIVFSWRHNSVDTTDQTAFELRYRVDGGSWQYVSAASATSTYTLPPETLQNDSQIEWQVRTWGDHELASPWSATALLRLSQRPAAGIVSPGAEVTGTRATVEWTYSDAEGTPQSAWEAKLLDGPTQQVIETKSGSGTTTTTSFDTRILDEGSYSIEVRVRDGHQLWSNPATSVFTGVYLNPPLPTLHVTWDKDLGAVVILPEQGVEGEDTVPTHHIEIYKSQDDGTWELIDDEAQSGVALVDPVPPLNVQVNYMAIAVSDLPSATDGVVSSVFTASDGWVFWNYGSGFGTVLRARFDVMPTHSVVSDKILRQFAGRAAPVEYSGNQTRHLMDISFTLDEYSSGKEDFIELGVAAAPVCYRLPNGEKHFVSVTNPRFSETRELAHGREIAVSMSMERVENA